MAVKPFIMDNKVVVGVGNIYASEALFRSGIRPNRAAGRISKKRYLVLGAHIKDVLAAAIEQGGTTLRDFVNSSGEPGYFQQTLAVYGRGGKECVDCGGVLKDIRLGQRSSVFCPNCQRQVVIKALKLGKLLDQSIANISRDKLTHIAF